MVFPTTSGELAKILGAEVFGSPEVAVRELATLEQGGPGSVTFIRDPKYAMSWPSSKAGTAIASTAAATPECRKATGPGRALLIVPDADVALIVLLGMLVAKPESRPAGIHASAFIDPAAVIDPSVYIGPHCVIGPRVSIGRGAVLHERVSIAEDCIVGDDCELYPNVVLYPRVVIGSRVILHAGAVIGTDGFGYRSVKGKGLVKIPHAGIVVVEDDVEIGANSCIDRAKFGFTLVGAGSKLDNLVQVGHGVQLGRSVVLCALVGLAGSVRVEDGAMVGGLAGVADGLVIGSGAMVGGHSAVATNIAAGERVFGVPATSTRQIFSERAFVTKLFELRGELFKLLKRAEESPPPS